MAEQYSSFQSKGPNIDVNLFPNAISAGINQGNAQDNTWTSIFKGINEGVKTGLSAFSTVTAGLNTIEKTQAQSIQNEINSDPEVMEAHKQGEIAQAKILNEKAKAAEDGSAALAERAKAALTLAEATQELGDLTFKDTLNKALDNPQTPPEVVAGLLQQGQATLGRDTEYAQQALARAGGRVDPALLDNMRKGVDAVEIDKTRVRLSQANDKALQDQAIKRKEKIDEATSELQLDPNVKDVMINGANGKPYDPKKLDIVRAGDVELDPTTKLPKIDAGGQPIISSHPNPDDNRYFGVYDGKPITTYGQERGKELAKMLPDYRIGTSVITGNVNMSSAPQMAAEIKASVNFEGTGLATQEFSQRADTVINDRAPDSTGANISVPDNLKTPEQIARFQSRLATLDRVPREYRETVRKVESSPYLRNETPIVKALASVESGGNVDAQSETKVRGIMQVTGDTAEGVLNKYPKLRRDLQAQGLSKTAPEASVLIGKVYLADLLVQFGDQELALAAYSAAGPGTIAAAIANTRGKDKSWVAIKPQVEKILLQQKDGESRWNQAQNYPEKVLKFFSFYNGR